MKLNIVVFLEGFHTMMSHLGSIGYLMGGSGLEGLFEAVYSKNKVHHIMSGKAVSRALTAHLLVESALTCVPPDKCTSWNDSQDTFHLVFSNLQQGELYIDEVNDDVHIIKFQNEFETGKYELSIMHCQYKDVHQGRKNQEFDCALRMYTQNFEFVWVMVM